MPLSFREIDILHGLWGGQSCPQAGLPAGWTRWKAGPQAEKPAPQVVPTGVSGNERFGVMGDNPCNARAGGLFLHSYCPRMVLAVKGSSAMMKRIMPLTAPGHSLTTFSWEEEKAALIRPKAYTSRFQVSPIPPNVLPPLIPSVQAVLFHGVSRAEGPSQQTTKGDGLSHYARSNFSW